VGNHFVSSRTPNYQVVSAEGEGGCVCVFVGGGGASAFLSACAVLSIKGHPAAAVL